MPNITGTGSADNIDVTNDSGTLNGTSQGTPINDIRARGGNDTILVSDSTIANDVRGNGGADTITLSGSTVSGVVNGGNGHDTINILSSSVNNVRLAGGNDVVNFWNSSVSGDIRGGNGNDALNLPVGTIVNDSTHGTFTVTLGTSYNISSGTFTLLSGNVITYSQFESGADFPCFTHGTLIDTHLGPRPIEDIQTGDLIQTYDGEAKVTRWIGSQEYSKNDLIARPKLRPIRIMAGALGTDQPNRDLLVSRQHRMLVQSKIARRMFGTAEVLLSAIKLTELPGIYIDETVENVEYFHLLFDQHEVLIAEGSPTESLFTGPEALKSISPEAREEILTIFPEVATLKYEPEPARYIPSGKSQKRLVIRHLKNNKPMLCDRIRLSHWPA